MESGIAGEDDCQLNKEALTPEICTQFTHAMQFANTISETAANARARCSHLSSIDVALGDPLLVLEGTNNTEIWLCVMKVGPLLGHQRCAPHSQERVFYCHILIVAASNRNSVVTI